MSSSEYCEQPEKTLQIIDAKRGLREKILQQQHLIDCLEQPLAAIKSYATMFLRKNPDDIWRMGALERCFSGDIAKHSAQKQNYEARYRMLAHIGDIRAMLATEGKNIALDSGSQTLEEQASTTAYAEVAGG